MGFSLLRYLESSYTFFPESKYPSMYETMFQSTEEKMNTYWIQKKSSKLLVVIAGYQLKENIT